MNVKVNDTVLVLTGKYKCDQGNDLKTYPLKDDNTLQSINIVLTHARPNALPESRAITAATGYKHRPAV